MSVGLAMGEREISLRLLSQATLVVDGRNAGALRPGPYRVELHGKGWAEQQDPEMLPNLVRVRGPVVGLLAPARYEMVLIGPDGKTVASARRQLSFRGGRVVLWREANAEPTRVYPGQLDVLLRSGGLTVVDRLPLEAYLEGVVAAEMSAWAPLEALKAQAVASRSLALARRAAHRDEPFELCADVHCQVFRGVPADPGRIREAVRATRGLVVSYRGQPAEALFSANCGGHTESAARLWGGPARAYLRGIVDAPGAAKLDLTSEAKAARWIRARPRAFCQSAPEGHFRWSRRLDAAALGGRIARFTGKELGSVTDLRVKLRGVSGRATEVRITGTRGFVTLRGELRIRQVLANPPLPSSCFVVEKTGGGFVLYGAGYGHGVGMCQDGAVGMARAGYDYRAILRHYYPGTRISRMY